MTSLGIGFRYRIRVKSFIFAFLKKNNYLYFCSTIDVESLKIDRASENSDLFFTTIKLLVIRMTLKEICIKKQRYFKLF